MAHFGRVTRVRLSGPYSPASGSHETRRWREMDSNLYGAFPVKWWFLVFAGSLFGGVSR